MFVYISWRSTWKITETALRLIQKRTFYHLWPKSLITWFQGRIQGEQLRRQLPLKLTKVTVFTMILYNSENSICDIKQFFRPLFRHSRVVKYFASLLHHCYNEIIKYVSFSGFDKCFRFNCFSLLREKRVSFWFSLKRMWLKHSKNISPWFHKMCCDNGANCLSNGMTSAVISVKCAKTIKNIAHRLCSPHDQGWCSRFKAQRFIRKRWYTAACRDVAVKIMSSAFLSYLASSCVVSISIYARSRVGAKRSFLRWIVECKKLQSWITRHIAL